MTLQNSHLNQSSGYQQLKLNFHGDDICQINVETRLKYRKVLFVNLVKCLGPLKCFLTKSYHIGINLSKDFLSTSMFKLGYDKLKFTIHSPFHSQARTPHCKIFIKFPNRYFFKIIVLYVRKHMKIIRILLEEEE